MKLHIADRIEERKRDPSGPDWVGAFGMTDERNRFLL